MLSEGDRAQMRADYRRAKYKKRMISILCDLYLCSRYEVLQTLGLEIPARLQREHELEGEREKMKKIDEDLRSEILRRYTAGETATVLEKEYGVRKTTIYGWRSAEIRRAGAEKKATGGSHKAVQKPAEAAGEKLINGAEEVKQAETVLRDAAVGLESNLRVVEHYGLLTDEERGIIRSVRIKAEIFAAGMRYIRLDMAGGRNGNNRSETADGERV